MEVSLIEWIGLFIIVFEVVARAIPGERWKGILGYAIDALKVISDFLNRRGEDNDQIIRR